MIRKTKRNSTVSSAKTESIVRKLEHGNLDRQDRIAQEIGHRKPYTGERLFPHEKSDSEDS